MSEKNYRYCFYCDKWKTKSEINEVDLGGGNKTYNCNVCRKDLGNQLHIFYCHTHPEEILKVWGTLEGINKEKVFFKECPQENQEQTPNKSPLLKIGIGVLVAIVVIGGLFLIWRNWKKKNNKN